MYDVVIVGTGIAGLTCALKLSAKNPELKIACFSKNSFKNCNTALAQGGIACVGNRNDDYEMHISDTLKASDFTSKPRVVDFVVKNAKECIAELEKWGVPFNKTNSKDYELGLEGGHSQARIVHVNDHTGKAVLEVLLQKVETYKNISLISHQNVYQLLVENNKVHGLVSYNSKQKNHQKINTQHLVLATGGIGQLFKCTTNSLGSTGDGLVLALNAGAKIKNLKYIQFHPTAFFEKNKKRMFLISEAVRGKGAHILNAKGERFLFNTDSRGELATRDIISTAIYTELKKSKKSHVYLDLRHLTNFEIEFPSISAYLIDKEIDWEKDLIPIVPAAHYQCGGIEVDINAKTCVDNLYAIGECSDTGLHGKNRLASNSLLEAFIFADNCASEICKQRSDLKTKQSSKFEFKDQYLNVSPIKRSLKKIHAALFDLKKTNEIKLVKQNLMRISEDINSQLDVIPDSFNLIQLKNQVTLLSLIANDLN